MPADAGPESTEGRFGTVSAALLTGGASTRMGRDKAHVVLDEAPIATRLSEMLGRLFEEVLLVGGDPPGDAIGRRVPDIEGPRCALRGLVSALSATDRERVVVIATDLPLMTPDLLLALVAWPEADAVIPRDANGAHPLAAIYRRESVLPHARANLAANRLAMRDLLGEVETRYIEAADLAYVDAAGSALTNVNTPAELEGLRT